MEEIIGLKAIIVILTIGLSFCFFQIYRLYNVCLMLQEQITDAYSLMHEISKKMVVLKDMIRR